MLFRRSRSEDRMRNIRIKENGAPQTTPGNRTRFPFSTALVSDGAVSLVAHPNHLMPQSPPPPYEGDLEVGLIHKICHRPLLLLPEGRWLPTCNFNETEANLTPVDCWRPPIGRVRNQSNHNPSILFQVSTRVASRLRIDDTSHGSLNVKTRLAWGHVGYVGSLEGYWRTVCFQQNALQLNYNIIDSMANPFTVNQDVLNEPKRLPEDLFHKYSRPVETILCWMNLTDRLL